MRIRKWMILVCLGFFASPAYADSISLSTHSIDWALVIPAPGFVVEYKTVTRAQTHFMATNNQTKLNLSGFLEAGPGSGTAKDAREYYWHNAQQSPFKKEQVKMTELGQAAMVEYFVPEHMGLPVRQKHKNAYYVKGDYWFDVHVSKALFKEEDEALFSALLTNIGFAQKNPQGKRIQEYRVFEDKSFKMTVPQMWIDEVNIDKATGMRTVEFFPEKKEVSSKVAVTPIPIQKGRRDFRNPTNIRQFLEVEGGKLLPNAVEKVLLLKPIRGTTASGFHYTLTDKNPKLPPGEYRFMTQGGINVGDLLVMFTIFTNEKASPVVGEALEMISGARIKE